jgi:hypothetical protein
MMVVDSVEPPAQRRVDITEWQQPERKNLLTPAGQTINQEGHRQEYYFI